ncbi:BCCT family transporter, partial [Roseicella aquatilis]
RNRLTWAFALAFIAVGLLVIGGLKTVQSLTIITALPLIPVLLLLSIALLRWLRKDFGDAVKKPVLIAPRD